MTCNALESSIEGIKSVWGSSDTEVIAGCRQHLKNLPAVGVFGQRHLSCRAQSLAFHE